LVLVVPQQTIGTCVLARAAYQNLATFMLWEAALGEVQVPLRVEETAERLAVAVSDLITNLGPVFPDSAQTVAQIQPPHFPAAVAVAAGHQQQQEATEMRLVVATAATAHHRQ
jgi:hypothetical protein